MVSQADRRAATLKAILAAATQLFGSRGFSATSIDDIAADAGIAKGAVYHHFKSKEDIFAEVLERTQQSLAAKVASAVRAASAQSGDRLALMKLGVRAYLNAATQSPARRIVLIDGPGVLGWEKWREIDTRYFGAGLSAPPARGEAASHVAGKVDPIGHVLLGAVTEAAMVCARANNRKEAVEQMMGALDALFDGLFKPRS